MAEEGMTQPGMTRGMLRLTQRGLPDPVRQTLEAAVSHKVGLEVTGKGAIEWNSLLRITSFANLSSAELRQLCNPLVICTQPV